MALLNDAFDNLSLFYENSSTVIYKGVRKADGIRVILKSHKNPDEMGRIKHEFDLLNDKEIAGVNDVLDISYNDDRNYLVMRDSGAEVLDSYLAQNDLDLPTQLRIAENAAAALASIHEAGIVHCDIKPANILIHPDTLQVWYIDFGISFAINAREAHGEGFAGTLEFMAPEQTGRLEMVVDHRSDLYSLGITMYFMITGQLPFTGSSAVELIHAQTVQHAVPLSSYVAVDPTVEALVLKLMEKSPRKRYQSAESLAYDLSAIRQLLVEKGEIDPKAFTLGEKDIFASLEPSQKLYGKQALADEMKAMYHSTPRDTASLILLHGPAGGGKSSLLNNFEQYCIANNAYLLRGEFSWSDNAPPYSAIRELFEDFELFAYNANLPLPEYSTRIQEALGDNAQALIDVLPSFGSILGEQPPVMKLNPLEAQQRAKQVFSKALEILCDAPFPYVFVFENAHWADQNSLNLLLDAVEAKGVGNCIMVLSYRDDDPSFLAEIGPKVQGLDRRSLDVLDISVPHLSREDVIDLAVDFFEQDNAETRELGDIIYNATEGVLSQIRNYLQLLYRSNSIRFDAESDSWEIALNNLDHTVLESMEDKYATAFKDLTPTGKDMLTKLSCLGESFDILQAVEVFGFDESELRRVLAEKADRGFVIADKRDPNMYFFAHKTVFEVCYHQMDEETRNGYHKLVVNKLFPKYKDDADAMLAQSALFTRQILFSDRSLYSDEVLQAVARCKLTAAEEIMAAANMGQAVRVFQNGLRLMGDDPFGFNHSLAFEIYLNYALCCFALHEYDKAKELFETAVAGADSEAERYTAYYTIVKQYLSTADWENAKIYVKRYLDAEGLLLPPDADPLPAGDAEYAMFRALTGEKGIMLCCEFEQTDDPLVEHHGNMLALLSCALLFSLDDDAKCKYYLYRTINFAVNQQRIFTEFTLCFCVGAARYASIRDFSWAKHLIETGLTYAEQNGTGQAFLWCVYGNMISHWVNPLSETVEIYKRAKYHAVMEGNAFYEAYADMMLLNYHSFLGENLDEYHRETQATLHNLQRAKLTALQANFTTFRQYARCLLGRTAAPDTFDDAQFQEASLEDIRGTWNGTFNDNFFYIYRMRALYIHHYYKEAVAYAEKYAELAKKYNMSAYLTNVQFYYYYSLALLEVTREEPESMEKNLHIIRQNQQNLEFYAKLNPTNFEFKYMLVESGIKGLTQDTIELVDDYATCHRGFMMKGLIWDAIFVERLIANLWQRRGVPQYVIIHKRNALGHYKAIGARYLVRSLHEVDEEFNKHIHATSTMKTQHEKTTFLGTVGTRNTNTRNTTGTRGGAYSGINAALDFQALLEVLEKLIDRDTLPGLAAEFAGLLLQNGNAEKALLFLEEGSVTNLMAAKYAIDDASDFNDAELPMELAVIEDDIVPKKLVEMARSRGETLCANSARNEFRMVGDAYINKHTPESFLCIPISSKGKYLGSIYLENASLPGSFPEGRVRFLRALVRQTSALILNLQNVAKMADYTKDLERRISSYLSQQNALIAGIAHEINSPVGVCVTVASKIHEKTLQIIEQFESKQLGMRALYKYLEETRDGLNIINNNVMRAGNLVQNFKKMSVEQSTEVFENLELAPTISSIVEYVRPGVKKRIETIDIDIPEGLWIHSSQGVLAQIFTNLIMNSSIHGFENRDKENNIASIKVTDLPAKEQIEIIYTDNGKGMTEEEKEKVFQPFFTTKRNRGGSGLGGHIILTLVTQTLGGSVRCESTLGEGTTYYITLPKQAKQVTQEEAAQ